jgi:hypothetical protein
MDAAKQARALLEASAPEGYKLARVFRYRDKDGKPAQLAVRYEPIVSDGKRSKQFRQFSVGENGKLIARAIPTDRPLYNLPELIANPDKKVLIVEGEGVADAAAVLFPDLISTTSIGGSRAVAKTDWRPLAGRDLALWPDHDRAGGLYAAAVREHLPQLKVVKIPETWPDKCDLEDDLPLGVAGLRQMIDEAAAQIHLEEAIASSEAKPLLPTTESLSGNGKGPMSPHAKEQQAAAKALADKYCDASGNPISEKQLKNQVRELSDVDYDRERKAIARAAGIRAPTLDKIREKAKTPTGTLTKLPVPDDVRDRLLAQHAEAALTIIDCTNVLELLVQETSKVIAGEEGPVKILYLIGTSRLFPKPMNGAIKGPSSAGKSEIREKVLAFFPPESVISFTSMSEKALVFDSRPFQHTILSMAEAISVEEQGLQDLLLRELMSAGRLTHTMTIKRGNDYESVIVTKEGPVAFMVTTTKNALHPENETRMLSIELDDSEEQTGRVLNKVAETEGLNIGAATIDVEPWREFQRWLAIGNTKVVVPYARELVTLIPCTAVRLRRDSGQILRAIKAHALLHRQHREVDERGQIVADVEHDYAAVRELLLEIVGAAAGTKLSKAMKETVDAVREATKDCVHDSDGTSSLAIAQLLRLDNSAARRRLLKAQSAGLIVNHETRPRQPGKYRVVSGEEQLGDVLPTPAELDVLLQYPRKSVPSCYRTPEPLSEQDGSDGKPDGKAVADGKPMAADGKPPCHRYDVNNEEENGIDGTMAQKSGGREKDNDPFASLRDLSLGLRPKEDE